MKTTNSSSPALKVLTGLTAFTLAVGTTGVFASSAFADDAQTVPHAADKIITPIYVSDTTTRTNTPPEEVMLLDQGSQNLMNAYNGDVLYIIHLSDGAMFENLESVTMYGTSYRVIAPDAARNEPAVWMITPADDPTQTIVNPTTSGAMDVIDVAVFPITETDGSQSIVVAVPSQNLPAANAEADSALNFSMKILADPEQNAESALTMSIAPATAAQQSRETQPAGTTRNTYTPENVETVVTTTVTSTDTAHNDIVTDVTVHTAEGTEADTVVSTDVSEETNGNVDTIDINENISTTVTVADGNDNANDNTNGNANAAIDDGKALAQTGDDGADALPIAAAVTLLAGGVAVAAGRKAHGKTSER